MKIRIIKENTQDNWLELEGSESSVVKGKKLEPIWDTHIICKWDGCTDYRHYSNGYDWRHDCKEGCQCMEDYIHICSVDGFIEMLKEVRKIGKEFYKGKSGEEYWD